MSLLELGISAISGFLPEEAPLRRLRHPRFEPWESIVDRLPHLIKTYDVRQHVDVLPILSDEGLDTEMEWQRAYLLLSLMSQSYIWAGQEPSERLPPALSLPLMAVSTRLGLPPTTTYAALNLWNFAPASASLNIDLCNPDNIIVLHTFTGTPDESWFYAISNAIEARGGKTIPMMLEAMDAALKNDTTKVSQALCALTVCLVELETILGRIYEKCDPCIFYHKIRPLLAGTKNMSHAGLPRGVLYDEGGGRGKWRQYSGPNNAQSSLVPFFDVVLGVQHCHRRGTSESVTGADNGFLKEMRDYMPKQHAKFLDSLCPFTIRDFAMAHAADHPIITQYNCAVKALTVFRNKHIQIVTRYIILPSKTTPPKSTENDCSSPAGDPVDVRNASSAVSSDNKKLLGTGGTLLVPFLKENRDDTTASLIRINA